MSKSPPPDSTSDFILRTEHLTKVYPDGAVNALRNVSLSVRLGEFLAIMGPSGSGKSTLLNLIGALDTPSSGEVYYRNRAYSEMTSLDAFRSDTVGFVFQSFYLLPTLTAAENVQIPMFESSLSPRQRKEKALQLLDSVGMSHRVRSLPNKLSVGERQRVAIARAMANEPSILLADEPTGNLDSKTGDEILDLFDELHRQRGVTLVVITHGQDVAKRAQRVVRLRDGRIADDP